MCAQAGNRRRVPHPEPLQRPLQGRNDFHPPPHFRRNFLAFLIDWVCFGVFFSFVSLNSVLPGFVRELSGSEPVVGLISTIFNGGWVLPQLGVAAALSGRPRKKPIMLASTSVSRAMFLLLALSVWTGLPRHPTAMLVVFFSALGLFTVLDGVASVTWFDLMARAVPLERRGRLVGIGQVVSGLLGAAAGGLVSTILASPSSTPLGNYALLFTIGSAIHVPGLLGLSLVREPPPEVDSDPDPDGSTIGPLAHLAAVWQRDATFRRLMAVRWLAGMIGLASSFYVIHATEVIGLSAEAVGWFISAERIGGIVASLGLGWLSERRGPRPAIWLGIAAALMGPLWALLIHFSLGSFLAQSYVVVFFLIGFTNGSWMLGVFNYLLEMAPPGQRAIYIGLANTLMLALVPAPVLGGLLLGVTSYPVLFTVTALGVAGAMAASLSLRDLPRQEEG